MKDEQLLQQLAIPPLYWDAIAESWRQGILLSMAVWILYGAVPTLRLSCWNIMRIRQRHFTKLPGFNGLAGRRQTQRGDPA